MTGGRIDFRAIPALCWKGTLTVCRRLLELTVGYLAVLVRGGGVGRNLFVGPAGRNPQHGTDRAPTDNSRQQDDRAQNGPVTAPQNRGAY
jgi:hypothetical protein